MWARNFFCCALMGKRFQGVKDYPWGARKMHNEVRPSANTWRIPSRLLTHCMLTFAFEPKRVSFVCVTKKHTFPRGSSRWQNSQPPNSSPKFRLQCILKAKTLWSFLYQMARKSFWKVFEASPVEIKCRPEVSTKFCLRWWSACECNRLCLGPHQWDVNAE